MNTLNNLKNQFGEELSRSELKHLTGGAAFECLAVGEPCTGNVQCCSNRCVEGQGGLTGAKCGNTGGHTIE